MLDIIFDMETQDPDDVFALCFLSSHPQIDLLAITINPGSCEQVGLIRSILERLGKPDIPIGARNPKANNKTISDFHFDFFGQPKPSNPDAIAHELLAEKLTSHPEATLLTGAPLHNIRLLLNNHLAVTIRRWVAQGGFAGDNIVPSADRLPQFVGYNTRVSHNFSVDAKATKVMLASNRIKSRDIVSKNVCHGVVYDAMLHERLSSYRDANAGLALIYAGMERYLQFNPEGKIFHDPLAACVAVDRSVVTFAEVEVFSEKGEWGARLAEGTDTYISIAVDRERFFQTLVAH